MRRVSHASERAGRTGSPCLARTRSNLDHASEADPNWADRAPALAGFPGLTEERGERVLEKGTGPAGETLRPPMHIYHMNQADAKAIIAYLRSLQQSPH